MTVKLVEPLSAREDVLSLFLWSVRLICKVGKEEDVDDYDSVDGEKKLVFFSVSVPMVRPLDLQWNQYEWVCTEDSDSDDAVMSCHCLCVVTAFSCPCLVFCLLLSLSLARFAQIPSTHTTYLSILVHHNSI